MLFATIVKYNLPTFYYMGKPLHTCEVPCASHIFTISKFSKQLTKVKYSMLILANQIEAVLTSTHNLFWIKNQRTIGPENAHLKPDPGVLSHHEMTLTLNTHAPLLNS